MSVARMLGVLGTLETLTRPGPRPEDNRYDYEPPLTGDELVAVRGLIQERYPNFAGAAASLADVPVESFAGDNPSVREDKQRTASPVDPQPHSSPVVVPRPAGDGSAAAVTPQAAAAEHSQEAVERLLTDSIEHGLRVPRGFTEIVLGKAQGIALALAVLRSTTFETEWQAGLDRYENRTVCGEDRNK